jgi:hypothetical protein
LASGNRQSDTSLFFDRQVPAVAASTYGTSKIIKMPKWKIHGQTISFFIFFIPQLFHCQIISLPNHLKRKMPNIMSPEMGRFNAKSWMNKIVKNESTQYQRSVVLWNVK